MANLPLESNFSPVVERSRERLGSVVSMAMMCGVIAADSLFSAHYIALLALLSMICLMVSASVPRIAVAMVMLSFTAGGIATQWERYWHHTTMLQTQEQTTITATIIAIEHQQGQRARLYLSDLKHHQLVDDAIIRATIDQMPEKVPERISERISERLPERDVSVGDQFHGKLRLFPLSPPLFANWPDYARKSWRSGIVATAYGVAPTITAMPARPQSSTITRLRDSIQDSVRDDFSATNATLAKALFIGVRDFSDKAFYTPFRKAGLAHLLAISGLHMGLFCFGIYGLFRLILALPVQISAYVAHHKIAAILAMASGLFYLVLAGLPISAIRAYLMTALVLCAVTWGRRAVTLRNINVVFMLFLLFYPSVLYQPAFQLSFTATYGIVMFHDSQVRRPQFADLKWVRRFYYLSATSAIAIGSTFFITAYHFGVISLWGIMANIIAIPYTGLVIMPLGVVYLCALALGVGAWVAPLTDSALTALVYFAGFIAEFPLTDIRLKKPPLIFLPLYAIACIALYLAPRKGRIAVIAFVIAGVFLASGQNTPKGAITGTVTKDSYFIRFAYLDEGRLYHTHRLSDFWTDSYQKLLGLYDVSTYVACRNGCTITLSNDDKIIIVKTNRTISCPAGRGLIIAPRAVACDGYQMIMIDDKHISIKLFHSNALGYYPHRKTKPQPHRVWRIF